MQCHVCGVSVYKKRYDLNKCVSKKFFCTKSCQTKWRNSMFIGEKHANWKHGKTTYRLILQKSDRLKKCVLCGITDTRILAVHHIDKDRYNNKVQNLAWLCHNCHYLVHHDNVELRRFQDQMTATRNMVPIV